MNDPLRLAYMSPAELAENPANWRTHPDSQLAALTGAIAEVGWAGACLYNERTGRLIDGHARRKSALEQGCEKIPVLIGNWDEATERKILATLDPLVGMATADAAKLDALMADLEIESPALQAMLDGLHKEKSVPEVDPTASEPQLSEILQRKIIIDCANEMQQTELLDRFAAEGLKCKAMMI